MIRRNKSGLHGSGAFTLIEMLVVITIIGLLIALAVPALTRTMEANRLTAAGEGFANRLSQAQQLAASKNQRVQLWFIYSKTGDSLDDNRAYRSYAICEVPANGQQQKVIAGPFAIEAGVVIAPTERLSPLLGASPSIAVPDTLISTGDNDARAAVIELAPDGGMRKMRSGNGVLLPVEPVLAESFLTFLSDTPAELQANMPKNFYAIQIDPYTSRARSFRPTIQ